MIKEFNIDVPMSLAGISLSTYQKWNKISERNPDADDNFTKVKLLQTFCNLSIEDTYDIPLNSFDEVITHLSTLLDFNGDLIPTFTIEGADGVDVDFGFIPDLDKMTFGEWIDLDSYINDWEQMHKAMAVLFRPVTLGLGKNYNIEKYEGSGKYSEVMKDMPLDVVLGAMVFFYRLENKLAIATTNYSVEVMEKELEVLSKQISELDGDGIKAFTLSLKVIQAKSMRSLLSPYTQQ